METVSGEISAFEQHLQGARIEDVPPITREELPAGEPSRYGLRKDGTPKRAPGRKAKEGEIKAPTERAASEKPALPPSSVERPSVAVADAQGAQAVQPDSLLTVDVVPKKVPFLFTASESPVTQSDRKDRAIRHQLLFAGIVKVSCSALARVPPSPNVVNPLAALIALKEEREQALFLPNVMMGVAVGQIVAAVVLAKNVSEASKEEVDTANKAYDDLLRSLNF